MRGVPLITLLFVASTMLNYFLPPGSNFNLLVRVMIMMTFFQQLILLKLSEVVFKLFQKDSMKQLMQLV